MSTAKRALIKLAIVGTMAGGIIGMPLVASAQAELNEGFDNCHGVLLSSFATTDGGVGKIAREEGFDVREAQQDVRLFCEMIQDQQ